jgi:hypothetical protein
LVGGIGFCSIVAATWMKLGMGTDMTGNPFLLLGILSTILSVQFFSLGLMVKSAPRIYFTNEHRNNYQIRERVNFKTAEEGILKLTNRAA